MLPINTLTVLIICFVYFYRTTLDALIPLLRKDAHTVISFPTRELTGGRVTFLLLYHIARSLLRRIGFGPNLSVSSSVNQDAETEHRLKGVDISLSMPFRITSLDLKQYSTCISPSGIQNKYQDILQDNGHCQLILSALTEPSMLLLLSKINCPIDPIGSVNVRNRLEIVQPALLLQSLNKQLEEKYVKLRTTAKLDESVKKVKRGWEFKIIVELLSDIEGTALYRQEFTMLQFHKHSSPPESIKPDEVPTEAIGSFKMGAAEPGDWAKVSRDYNPIHTSNIAAKLLGFNRKIAHGNHVVAKAIDILSQPCSDQRSWMEVEFRRPVAVPSKLDVRAAEMDENGTTRRWEVWTKGKVATLISCGI
ncbi:uncharacterized protein IL334_004034 [Kwoniella shivajii]|uniref:MaoC-like domain-containing protein n=1 Tax=Kwoniella shivajii TaxID=564305 RepID=A0ABZ1CZB2_9TREE|nr:hypothetical protein IL334_004034 [Kwoniella shivajii]